MDRRSKLTRVAGLIHNEEGHIAETVTGVAAALARAKHPLRDPDRQRQQRGRTEKVGWRLGHSNPAARRISTTHPTAPAVPHGGGFADFRADVMAVFTADGSDAPANIGRMIASS
jgi:hypothetical protein